MALRRQKEQFYQTIAPSLPNEWEVDDIFEKLEGVDTGLRETLLAQVVAIWPVSHSLCFSYLEIGAQSAGSLAPEMYPEWVRQILAIYEKSGLVGARRFMSDVKTLFLQPLEGKAGVRLEEITGTLVHLLRGISGITFSLKPASLPYTDTSTIYLPERLQVFSDNSENFLLYKLLAVLQYKNISSRLFQQLITIQDWELLYTQHADQKLMWDLFGIVQFARAYQSIQKEFPGLYRKANPLCIRLLDEIAPGDAAGTMHVFIRSLLKDALVEIVDDVEDEHVAGVLEKSDLLYKRCAVESGDFRLGSSRLLIGAYELKKSCETILLRRKQERDRFVGLMAEFLDGKTNAQAEAISEGNNSTDDLVDSLVVLLGNTQKQARQDQQNVKIENEGVDLPEELLALSKEIGQDLGAVPDAYVQAAVGVSGSGIVKSQNSDEHENSPGDFTGKDLQAAVYDEWDYRRDGYRKNWCLLYEKTLRQVRSNFVEATVAKYRSQHDMLKRQFEMLRTQERYCRRRRHGDEIDFDALVDALGDSRAGLAPSDRLFIRLMRDTRNISTLFLVDMSNSTEGWVGLAMKEALVLMTQVMKILGDPYGIYGFSGMKRSKSELYHIKHLEEPYGETVQQRIAAISPQDYTRMGPPIRHLTKKMLSFESKVKLMILLSDGKPEDYDGYEGKYAIEDTRKALLEARGCGIRSFCITIDKANHDYLPHMFGPRNFLFVNNVKKLPLKMAEMYRLISS